jgi:hypothetical protein
MVPPTMELLFTTTLQRSLTVALLLLRLSVRPRHCLSGILDEIMHVSFGLSAFRIFLQYRLAQARRGLTESQSHMQQRPYDLAHFTHTCVSAKQTYIFCQHSLMLFRIHSYW